MALTVYPNFKVFQNPMRIVTVSYINNVVNNQATTYDDAVPPETIDFPLSLEIKIFSKEVFGLLRTTFGLPAVYICVDDEYAIANENSRWCYSIESQKTILRFRTEDDMMMARLML
jgi:hypothetical protein